MRCSHRSTTWRVSAVAALVAASVPLGAARQAPGTCAEATVRAALEETVRSGMGHMTTSIAFEGLQCQVLLNPVGRLHAEPAPAARIDRRSTFVLTTVEGGRTVRIGWAAAVPRVEATWVRTTVAVRHGETFDASMVETARGMIPSVPIAPLPRLEEVIGAVAKRDLAPGQVITSAALSPAPLVRRRQNVSVIAEAAGAEIRLDGLALDSGARGDVVRVLNPETRRMLRARVIGAGRAEVVK